jgi:hypothetical protein
MLSVVLATILLSCVNPPEDVLKDFETAGIDTFAIGNYQAYMNYRLYDNQYKARFFLRIVKDTTTIFECGDFDLSFYNFCPDSSDTSKFCYLRNIDSDPAPEMIIRCYTGGNHCCENLLIVSLDDIPVIKDSPGTNGVAFGDLKDFDGDSIPEYSWSDHSWDWWRTFRTAFQYQYPRRYFPPLIWKWDGYKFRIANFQFPDSLLNAYDQYIVNEQMKLGNWVIPDSAKVGYSSNDTLPLFPPHELINVILAHYYAGDSVGADSILDAFWPNDIPGKAAFYSDFKTYLSKTPYWDSIKNSGWR